MSFFRRMLSPGRSGPAAGGKNLRAGYSHTEPHLTAPHDRPMARRNSVACPVEVHELEDDEEEPAISKPECVKQILVIYTGGTIGMVPTDHGYDCRAGYLKERIAENPRFNDGRSANDVLAISKSPRGNRVEYTIEEYNPILDSANLNTKDWVRIAKDIEKNYDNYDGFVVLHGTDTMAYTASALTYMFQNLTKPVILTGSQIPFSQLRNDAQDNLLEALICAADFCIPEVCLVFAHKVLRGCRSQKISSNQLAAFDSPNLPPLGSVGIHFNIDWDRVRRPNHASAFRARTVMSDDIGILFLFPGITAKTVKAFLSSGLRGVVIKTFGAGNFSQAEDILAVLRHACASGVTLVNTTQCAFGGVAAAAYAAGEALQRAGIITGLDMTTEAALTKLSFLLGQGMPVDELRKAVGIDLGGELTLPSEKFSLGDDAFIDAVGSAMRISTTENMKHVAEAIMPTLLCTYAAKDDAVHLQKLLDSGALPDMADYDGRTAMHLACQHNSTATLEVLLKAGADLSPHDAVGHTPMYEACLGHHHDLVRRLASLHAPLALDHKEAVGIYCDLAQHGKVKELETWAIGGADFNVADYDKRTPLHIATDEGWADVHELLVRYGAKPAADRWGSVPLASKVGSKVASRRNSAQLMTPAGTPFKLTPKMGAAPAPEPSLRNGNGYGPSMEASLNSMSEVEALEAELAAL